MLLKVSIAPVSKTSQEIAALSGTARTLEIYGNSGEPASVVNISVSKSID